MIITQDEKGGKFIVRCEGRLDATSSPRLEQSMSQLIDNNHNHLLIDLVRLIT